MPQAILPSANCCPASPISPRPGLFRAVGSSACRWMTSTPMAFDKSRATHSMSFRHAKSMAPTETPLLQAWIVCRQGLGPALCKPRSLRQSWGFAGESRRLHCLSVPPNSALSVVRMLGDAQLVANSRIIMEKPFGIDLDSAVSLNTKLHNAIHQLLAPHAWRLPFERIWRDPNPSGG